MLADDDIQFVYLVGLLAINVALVEQVSDEVVWEGKLFCLLNFFEFKLVELVLLVSLL